MCSILSLREQDLCAPGCEQAQLRRIGTSSRDRLCERAHVVRSFQVGAALKESNDAADGAHLCSNVQRSGTNLRSSDKPPQTEERSTTDADRTLGSRPVRSGWCSRHTMARDTGSIRQSVRRTRTVRAGRWRPLSAHRVLRLGVRAHVQQLFETVQIARIRSVMEGGPSPLRPGCQRTAGEGVRRKREAKYGRQQNRSMASSGGPARERAAGLEIRG